MEGAIFRKWKAGKSAVTRITIESNSNTLISSGKFIKIWDLKTKQLLKVATHNII